jgi:hypothetical protein
MMWGPLALRCVAKMNEAQQGVTKFAAGRLNRCLALATVIVIGAYPSGVQAQTNVLGVVNPPAADSKKQDQPTPADSKPKQCTQAANNSQLLVCNPGPDALRGLHWGVGLLYSSNLGGVGDVTLVQSGGNNTVRVTKANAAAARAAFELHYFIPSEYFFRAKSANGVQPSNGAPDPIRWAVGPFVSLNSKPLDNFGSSPALSSVGAGVMFGVNPFVDDATGQSVSHSVNIGIGWMIDTAVKELTPGVVDGQPTTLTQDQLTRTVTKNGFMAILSYNFALN